MWALFLVRGWRGWICIWRKDAGLRRRRRGRRPARPWLDRNEGLDEMDVESRVSEIASGRLVTAVSCLERRRV